MAKEVYMPALGMAQESGTLLRWLKAEGEAVTKGEPLMEVATDKTDVEIEAPASGVLRNVTAREGDEVPVGQVIALIAAADEVVSGSVPTVAPPSPVTQIQATPPAVSPVAARLAAEHGVDVSKVKATGGRIQKEDVLAYLAAQGGSAGPLEPGVGGRVPASPKARRLAREAGLELAALTGSGPEGAVLAADVEQALLTAPATSAPVVVEAAPAVSAPPVAPVTSGGAELPMSRMWKVMAERLTQSWTTVPHFYLVRDADAGQLTAWRAAVQPRVEAKITYTDLMVKAVALTLRRHARLNAAWVDGKIMTNGGVHIGLAVAVEDGLLVPVIRDADRRGLAEIAADRADLVGRAQAGKLSLEELQGGTFTISNLGMLGVDAFNAIVNPPQAAILAVGRIADRVVAVDGQPAVRPMLTLTLSCDHRVVDGARGAAFLDDLVAALEAPLRLLA